MTIEQFRHASEQYRQAKAALSAEWAATGHMSNLPDQDAARLRILERVADAYTAHCQALVDHTPARQKALNAAISIIHGGELLLRPAWFQRELAACLAQDPAGYPLTYRVNPWCAPCAVGPDHQEGRIIYNLCHSCDGRHAACTHQGHSG